MVEKYIGVAIKNWNVSGEQRTNNTNRSWYCFLLYDPYGPARAFIAKLLRKSPYEGRTWWREQVRKKPSGPARIAYGPHTGILSIARARSELKQLCCCINPDFSVKMSNIPNFVKKKKGKKREKGKAWWSYNKMLIDWVRSGRTGKYLALGHGARTSLRSVRTPWPRAKYFPVRPSHSVNKYIVRLGVRFGLLIQNNWVIVLSLEKELFFIEFENWQ